MGKWIQENFSWLSILAIAGVAKLISYNFWLGNHPVSIYVAALCLAALVYLSFCFIQYIERLMLISAYLWVCWNIVIIFSSIYLEYGIAGEGIASNIDNTLYLSISVWTLLGFGQVLPSEASRYWVQIEAIMGLLANGMLVALLFRLFAPWQQLVNNR